MTEDRAALEEEAIGWVIRTRDPGFADWEGFTAWLEQSEAHARLYDSLCLAETEIADHLSRSPAPVVPAPALPEPALRSRRWWVGGTVAASAAAMALLFTTIDRAPFPTREYVTAPGEKRVVQLADGSRVDMNGATRLVVDGARHARLDRGEALFTIVHDSARPFEVASGDSVVRDLGTVFDLVRTERRFTVSVSEGVIAFDPEGRNIRVPAGKSIERSRDGLALRDVGSDQVGGWREGRLVYEGASLGQVAEDLSRTLGLDVAADPGLAARPFSGIIQVEGKGEPALRAAAETLGVSLRRSGNRWLLAAS
jgi:transmembrane sensor